MIYPRILVILLAFVCIARAGRIDITESSGSFCLEVPTVSSRSLSRIFKDFPGDSIIPVAGRLLDSLGFFSHRLDTISADSICLQSGQRAWVDRVSVGCDIPFSIDSFHVLQFPRYYDAGELQMLAGEAIRFLGQRGYPFVSLSVSIDTLSEHHLAIQFDIQTDQKCVFGSPRLSGIDKTRESVLLSDLSFRPGDVFNIDKLEESRQRLLSRRYVGDVTIGAPVFQPSDPGDSMSVAQAVVPVHIRDDAGMGVDGALGFESDDQGKGRLNGMFNVSLLNLFRSGESGSIHYEGKERFQKFEFTIEKPAIFSLPLTASVNFGVEIEENSYGHMHGELQCLTQLPGMWRAGVALNGTETRDSLQSWQVYGVELVLEREAERYEAQVLSRHLCLRTGTAFADKGRGAYYRWLFDFSAGFHLPFFRRQAFVGKLSTQAITADQQDNLHRVERYRIGGHSSIRGYAEDQFPLSTVAYAQAEYHVYFNQRGSVFAFVDGGAGYYDDVVNHPDRRIDLLGYGVGVRMPARIGILSIAWARNYTDTKSFGRLHVRIQNGLGAGAQ